MKCAETLLDAGALISAHKTNGFTPLHYAAAGPHLSIVKLLISRGVAVDAPDHKGERAVDVAARVGSKAVVQALLDSGADVNAHTNNGRSWFASFFHTGFCSQFDDCYSSPTHHQEILWCVWHNLLSRDFVHLGNQSGSSDKRLAWAWGRSIFCWFCSVQNAGKGFRVSGVQQSG